MEIRKRINQIKFEKLTNGALQRLTFECQDCYIFSRNAAKANMMGFWFSREAAKSGT